MTILTPAQQRALEALKPGPLSAQAAADQFGVDVSAARRHLVALVGLGLATATDVATGRGRPTRMYRLSPAGLETGPRNYPALLAMLMQKVAGEGGRKQLLRYLGEIASDLAGPTARQKDARARLDLLMAKYNNLEFDTSATAKAEQITLVHRNCPFLTTASADPEAICRHLDQGMIEATFPGARVELAATMAEGAPVCRFIIHHGANMEA